MKLDDLLFESEINEVIKILRNGECLMEASGESKSNVVKSFAKRMGRPLKDATVVWRALEKKFKKSPFKWAMVNTVFTNWAKKWTKGKVQDIKKSQSKKTKTNRPKSDESYAANIAKYKSGDI